MAEIPRAVQRLHRMKVASNKFIDRIAQSPEDENVPLWTRKLREFVVDIAVMEHEAKAAAIKSELKKPGVEIKVPTQHFGVDATSPAVE